MIIYLHGFDSNSAGNYSKILQLQSIDPDVRFINYSTQHPRHDMKFLLQEVDKLVKESKDSAPLICGVGLGGYWSERIGFLCNIKQVMFNPNLFPQENMGDKIQRPEEYEDIATKCVENFRDKNRNHCLVILSRHDDTLDNQRAEQQLSPFYQIIWDEKQPHKFPEISQHLMAIKAFKQS